MTMDCVSRAAYACCRAGGNNINSNSGLTQQGQCKTMHSRHNTVCQQPYTTSTACHSLILVLRKTATLPADMIYGAQPATQSCKPTAGVQDGEQATGIQMHTSQFLKKACATIVGNGGKHCQVRPGLLELLPLPVGCTAQAHPTVKEATHNLRQIGSVPTSTHKH